MAIDKQLRYSRTREQEADRIGLSTLALAGMDPEGMSRMFSRMDRTYRFTRRPPEFLMTHPLTDSRVADARNQALAYEVPGRVYDQSPDYQMMRARAIVYYSDTPDAAVREFRKALEADPDDIGAEYGLAHALSLSGEHKQSVALAESLHSANRHKILFIATYAEALTAAGLADQAIKLLAHELVINPDNAPLSMLYAKALVAEGEFEMAENVLQRQSEVRRNDVDVWYELAEVSGQAGDILGVHLARAEFFALHGDYQRAIQHLEYAHRLASRSDTMLQARLDQRIIDLKTMIRERQG